MSNSAITQQVQGLATTTSPGLVQAGFYNVLPAGLVFPFAGNTVPAGFLECNGQDVSKTTYATLYASLGDTYATQIDPTTGLAWTAPAADRFRLPDYRGSFLRGVGTASGKDATTLGGYQGEKTKAPTTAFTGSAANTDLSHTHTATAIASFNPTGLASGSFWNATNSPVTITSSGASVTMNHGHTASIGAGGDNETRPINKGVRYIVKV